MKSDSTAKRSAIGSSSLVMSGFSRSKSIDDRGREMFSETEREREREQLLFYKEEGLKERLLLSHLLSYMLSSPIIYAVNFASFNFSILVFS